MSFDRKFNKDSKNVPKTVIFSLKISFSGDFVLDCPYKLCFWQLKFNRFSLWLYQDFLVFF